MMLLALLLQDWWNADWAHRRAIVMMNPRTRAVEAGTRVNVPVHLEFLKIADKSKADLSDVRLVYGGKEIPFEMERAEGVVTLGFKLQRELKRGYDERDTGYALYFGNAAAAAPEYDQSELYHLAVVTSSKEQVDAKLSADPEINAAVGPEGWRILGVDAKATEGAPARVVLRCPPPGRNQQVRVSLEWDDPAGAVGFVGLQSGAAASLEVDEATRATIADFIRALGSDDWEVRERASAGLVGMGRAALAQLREAARSGDLEVSARARAAIAEIESNHASRHAVVGLQWRNGETTAVGRWDLDKDQPAGREVKVVGKRAATLVLWREDASRGVDVELGDYTERLLQNMADRATAVDAPEEFTLLLWGDGANPFPKVRVTRITVAAEVVRQARVQPSVEPEETRPR